MKQPSTQFLIKGALIAILISMILNLSAIPVGFAQATRVEVVAPAGDVTVPTQFNVDINVVNVPAEPDALFAWQIKLYYNPTVLRWINATYPPGHVFEGKPFSPSPPLNDTDVGGTYVLVANSLQGDVPRFSGSGVLCRLSFEAKQAGTSTLIFSRPLGGVSSDTWLMNYDDASIGVPTIEFTAVDGSVTAVGSDTRLPTAISLNIDKSAMFLGASAVISGAINATLPDGTEVYIETFDFSTAGSRWLPLTTALTTGSQYSYTWTPTEENGTIGVRSYWTGSSAYKPATSGVANITISISPTSIALQPSAYTAGTRTLPLPTQIFTINVTVQGVTDLREWKIKLTFNQTILEASEISLPTYNVFGADYTLLEAIVNNTSGFVQASARSSTASFNGSGVLCQIRFRGIGAPVVETTFRYGVSDLKFDLGVTYLKDTPGAAIIFNSQQPAGTVRVETLRRQPSTITLEIPSQVTIGTIVSITGRITPTGAGLRVNVTITYRTQTMAEKVLAIVQTDSNGRYSYNWDANATGTYTFKASWAGEELYFGDTEEKPVTVVEQQVENKGPDLTLYAIIAGVAAIAVVAVVVVYLVKFRKGSKTPVS